jgi:2-polyprenyl-3-methyl-5-hydroxy-6-metoxy-1,4-benzoquinol methylase
MKKIMSNEGLKYDLIADDFAALRDSFNTEQKYLDVLISYVDKHAEILDLGCGHGFLSSYLINQGFKVTGVDASEKLLALAQKNSPSMTCLHGDIRDIFLNQKYDAILEWWCLFHLNKSDQLLMFKRFSDWLKPHGILEFTTGDAAYEGVRSDMLNQPLFFCSHEPDAYEQALRENNFEILLKETDQEGHLVWIARKKS